MRANLSWRKISILAVTAIAATLLGTSPGWSDEKTEAGVKLEFWKGHFDRGAEAFHDWDKERKSRRSARAATAPIAFRNT